ncbi:MAG: hydroxymethylbilane synthase [Chthoniobacterales bacterium]|nr:hydroxymethylbilane synthase [Chthoniobacterales bacterium]
MPDRNRIVLGTRGSDLARAQTRMVEHAIRSAWQEIDVSVQIITTRGDESAVPQADPVDRKAGRKGLFTSEIERALVAGEIDVAVHSAKDLPSEQGAGLEIGATLPRGAVDDVLVTKTAATIGSIVPDGTIATGSIRRTCQVRAVRPDLHIVDLRGNVPTRLRKLGASDWDGIILARAGLERLGFDLSAGAFSFEQLRYRCELLPSDVFLTAGGQGVLALQVRSTDDATKQFVETIGDAETLLRLRAEREFLRLLDGDCDSPVGVLAMIKDGSMTIRAQLFKPPAVAPVRAIVRGPADDSNIDALAARLMEQINGS